MDLVDYDQSVFDAIVADFKAWSEPIAAFSEITFIPISALKGDNVVEGSANMPWYDGPTLLHHLETVAIAGDRNLADWRFPVQWVVRPQNDERYHDYRGYARPGRRAASSRPARRSSCCPPAARRESPASTRSTARSTRPSRRSRSRCYWRTTSTSRAAT